MVGWGGAGASRCTVQQQRPISTISTITRSNTMTNVANPQEHPRVEVQPGPVSKSGAHAAHDNESAPDHPAASGRGAVVGLSIVLVAFVVLAVYGIWKRHHNDEVLADTTQQMAAPSVIALPP